MAATVSPRPLRNNERTGSAAEAVVARGAELRFALKQRVHRTSLLGVITSENRFPLVRIMPSQNPASRGADGAFELIFPVDFSLVVSLAGINGPVGKMFLRGAGHADLGANTCNREPGFTPAVDAADAAAMPSG